jgi:hypothetical protein
MMISANRPLLLSLALSAALAFPLSGEAAIKCWTNKEGVRECGNIVPPEYAQQESRTLDKRGITTEVIERAPTAEELEERARQEEVERLRLEDEERQKALEEQRRKEQAAYDRMLLSTYLTEEDILRSRDRKLVAIDATIELNRITIGKLQENLDKEKARAANLERQGKELPERTREDIGSLQNQIQNKQNYIASKEKERQELIDLYEADMERFRELKASGRKLR